MSHTAANSRSASNLPHCSHRTRKGRLCRLPVHDSASGVCFRHLALSRANGSSLRGRQVDPEDLSADLLPEPNEFGSARDIQAFLARLLPLLVRNRIAAKRAAVLTYICAQLMRSLREVDYEENSDDDENGKVRIILDSPRPRRDDPPHPSSSGLVPGYST